ncbi:GNAT family N-acetyltransferase [Streptomyces sp. XM83C]|jgi:RimJ/RimL family protein N-acetyltransferase|uniref:GNAT family N-acetyltransferase n=1 Tax=Streptomyces thermocoprophilus TaxID=78356 RepID=A0ABV5VJF3_9ACTN|nr:GNAT family N-acetyltransferase [Streptomyces sp. XM83C]MCK1822295.1 GNAT family N-acetyltransferase [Streptomyces sp. XM83C]
MITPVVRHFTEADIPLRSALLREGRFQANLTDFAVVSSDEALEANQRRTIEEEHAVKRMYTVCRPDGRTIGFAWITSIDWRAQSCELSFGVLPRYRGGHGAAAVAAMHRYVREELNMRAVINQVLVHNTMLVSAADLAAQAQVRCAYDSFTAGEWRDSCYWSQDAAGYERSVAEHEERRRAIAERIRAASGGAS